MMKSTKFLLPLLAALLLAGCDYMTPETRPGTWQPTGSNDANLAAELVNRHDLVKGRGSDTTEGVLAAQAIARLQADQTKPLLKVSTKK